MPIFPKGTPQTLNISPAHQTYITQDLVTSPAARKSERSTSVDYTTLDTRPPKKKRLTLKNVTTTYIKRRFTDPINAPRMRHGIYEVYLESGSLLSDNLAHMIYMCILHEADKTVQIKLPHQTPPKQIKLFDLLSLGGDTQLSEGVIDITGEVMRPLPTSSDIWRYITCTEVDSLMEIGRESAAPSSRELENISCGSGFKAHTDT